MTPTSVITVRNYIDGKWIAPGTDRGLDVENPATGEIIGRVPLSTGEDVRSAVRAAAGAFRSWKNVPASRRTEYLHVLLDLFRRHEDEITRILVRENGKSIPDSSAELKRTIENVETACAMPVLQQGDKAIGCSTGIDGEVMYLPKGVFAMIAPFNFPAMVPFWFLPYAIAAGNTFILKPSEQVPLTMARIAELIHETGLPAGVFNLVNGDREVAEALLDAEEVAGVSLVGSSKTAAAVRVRAARSNKRVQAMGGAKNHLVVMPDARVDQVVRNMVTSCFGCAGQRCMAASAIVCVGDSTYRTICRDFVAAAKKVIVADPLDPAMENEPMVMGPVISAAAKTRILGMIETGISEGAKLALDGRECTVHGKPNGHYVGPTVFVDVPRDSKVHRTEIFGPVVVILKADSLDDAIGIINSGEYGNGASIYTQDGYAARRFKLEADAGMIGVNVGIPAPVAYLPFGGMKGSQFSDIKAQGKSVIRFFTEEKIITERYWGDGD